MVAGLVYFDFDSARLKPDALPLLDEYVKALRGDLADVVVMIAGHTDTQGPDAYNQRLSYRRAKAIKDYLVGHGVDAKRLLVRGFGEAYPIASGGDERVRAMNRRSEFFRLDVSFSQ